MATCFKTALILSCQFIHQLWPIVSNTVALTMSELLVGGTTHGNVVAIVYDDPICVIPPELFHVAKVYLDDSDHSWQHCLDLLTASGT